MQSSLTGNRQASFRFSAVTRTGSHIGALSAVEGDNGQIELSQQAQIRNSGDLSRIIADGAMRDRIKIEYVLDEGQPYEQAWPIGVYFSASPVTTYDSAVASSVVEIYDGLLLLAQDKLSAPLHLPAGSDPIAEVLNQLQVVGADRVAITPTTKRLKEAQTHKAGSSRLQVINALLDTADYFGLHCDGNGVYQVRPYVEPMERPIEWRFLPGDESVHLEEIEVEDDVYSVPNKVVGISRTNGDVPPMVATAIVTDPQSPFHVSNLGYWRATTVEDIDVTTQEDLQARVDRLLREQTTVNRKLTVRHGWLPIGINSRVYFSDHGVTGDFIVQNQQIPLDAKGLVTSTLREVGR